MAVASPLEKRKYTLADFERLPEGPPFYEFDEGEIIKLATPTFNHQDIIKEFTIEIGLYLRQHRIGQHFMGVDVYLPDGKVYVPDFGFLSKQNLGMLWESDGKIHGAPDMVAEITSQDTNRDRVRKFQVYHPNGVQGYWLVNQYTLEIEEYRWTQSGYELNSRVASREVFRPEAFPGMEFNLAANLGVENEGVSE